MGDVYQARPATRCTTHGPAAAPRGGNREPPRARPQPSSRGARIAHEDLLHGEVVCYLDLPPALGALRLTGRVAWTWLRGTEHTLGGDRRSHYESGIEFTNPTRDQQVALATVLATLQAVQTDPGGTAEPGTPPKGASQSS